MVFFYVALLVQTDYNDLNEFKERRMTPHQLDVVNGLFEVFGAVGTWANAYKLYVDKKVMGVFWGMFAFITLWGIWNLFYYSGLNQPLSFYGGILLTSGNAYWLWLAYLYRGR